MKIIEIKLFHYKLLNYKFYSLNNTVNHLVFYHLLSVQDQ